MTRLTMTMNSDPDAPPSGLRFDYQLEVRNSLDSQTWRGLMTGRFYPSGGLGRGRGEIELNVSNVRAAEYPVEEFSDLAKLRIKYDRVAKPISIEMAFESTQASSQTTAIYRYLENADASGEMVFAITQPDVLARKVSMRSRWKPSGAGRADASVLEGGLTLVTDPTGVDCWGPDSRATYVRRGWKRPLIRATLSPVPTRSSG